jgi:hypothetical protein
LDQFDDDLMADQRLAAPISGDERKQAVLDLVPLAGAGRQVAHGDGIPSSSASFCRSTFHSRTREPLLPPPSTVTSKLLAWGVTRAAHQFPPTADRVGGEGGGVAVDAHAHPTGVIGDVADPVSRN